MANLNGHIVVYSVPGPYRNLCIGIPIPLYRRCVNPSSEERTTQTTYGDQRAHRGNPFARAVIAFVVIAVVAFFAVILFRGFPAGPGPYYGYPWYGWWFFPFGIFFFFIFLIFVSRLVFWPMGWGWRRRYWYGYGDAREILRQRYARGEITKEQFDQMNRDMDQR